MAEVDHVSVAASVFAIEAEAVAALTEKLDSQFNSAISLILESSGRVIICGMGKSGIVGKKISATLASTGTQSFSLHPGEAYHGDLGMVNHDDVIIAISYSGETDEVLKLLPFLKSNKNKIIAITGQANSTLATSADFHLNVNVKQEACPLQLAPTSSTTATLAMGDAIAVALMEARKFKPENFAAFHPGGSLGRRLLSNVSDEMITDNLPTVAPVTPTKEVLSIISKGGNGLAVVIDNDKIIGLITDGDLRRAIESNQAGFFNLTAQQIMTKNPKFVGIETAMVDALEIMKKQNIHVLLISDGDSLVGIVKE